MKKPTQLLCFAFIAFLCMVCVPKNATAQSKQSSMEKIKKSIVLITMFDESDGKRAARSYGSGTIINADGSILTNHHVLAKESENTLYDFYVISRKIKPNAPPDPFCIGNPKDGQLDPVEDLAIIRCSLTLGKRKYIPKEWPAIEATAIKKANVKPGTQIWVFGYSLQKHAAILKGQAGLASGWSENSTHQDSKPFIRTDANISLGMSGGAAIDSEGHFIGVPTAFRNTLSSKYAMFVKGKIGLIRTLESVNELFPKVLHPNALVIKVVDQKTKRPIPNATLLEQRKNIGPAQQQVLFDWAEELTVMGLFTWLSRKTSPTS